MFFDTHAHYDDNRFDSDRDELLSAMPDAGVGLILVPGCDVKSSESALALAERWDFIYAAVGIHPEDMGGMQPGDLTRIEALARHRRCVAIGEVGLDYYWDAAHKQEQKALFAEQLELALRLDLPVIVHDREAHGDCLELVSRYEGLRGVFHCYSGSPEMAEQLLRRGWYLGFDGPLTYKNNRKTAEVIAMCPLDRILLETDSPYMSPVPLRGRRNDSRNLCYIAERAAEIKGVTEEELTARATENGKKLFGIV